MSISRHAMSTVRSYSVTHPPGAATLPTAPGWDMLIVAEAAVITATTEDVSWTIPRGRALWRPDGPRVCVQVTRRTPVRCLYVAVGLVDVSPAVRVLAPDPLTRELLTQAVADAPIDQTDEVQRALVTLLVHRLSRTTELSLDLRQPRDPVARSLAAAITGAPDAELTTLITTVGGSRRTVERRFRAETGMSLGQWRRRARVLAALAMLDDGESVTRAAVRVGYNSPSAFVAAFRSELGSSPRQFLAGQSSRSSGSGTGSL